MKLIQNSNQKLISFQIARSAKHSSSTALSHARDIEKIYEKNEFHQFTHTTANGVSKPKPIFVSIVDGKIDLKVKGFRMFSEISFEQVAPTKIPATIKSFK